MTIETESAVEEEAPQEEKISSTSTVSSSSSEEVLAKPTSGPGKDISSKVLSTPAVRHMAKKNNVDISVVQATGKGGRVTKEDLINFMKKDSFVKEEPVAAVQAP